MLKNQIFWLFAAMLMLPLCPMKGAPPDSGWAEVWGDEFDGRATTTNRYGLDTNKWSSTLPWTNHGTNRWNSVNDAYWIADQCTYVSNGVLVIVNEPCAPTTFPGHSTFNYESGWAQSRNQMNYTWGYAEISAQYPNGTAMWPAWWLLGENGNWPPEVDVAERYPDATLNHGMYYEGSGGGGNWTSGGKFPNDPIYTMNTYGFEWNPAYTAWSKNGTNLVTFASQYVPSQPIYMILSGGVVTTNTGNGGSLADQSFPAYFLIDYVRLFKRAEYLYNGDFSVTNNQTGSLVGDWIFTNATVISGAGLNGDNALLLSAAATPALAWARQTVYGLVPDTSYLFSGDLRCPLGQAAYFGVTNYGGPVIESATNPASYALVTVNFTTGATNTRADVYARLDVNSGHNAYLDQLTLRRAAAVADAGFETGILSTYWDDGSYGSYAVSYVNQRSGERCLALTAAGSAVQQIVHGLQPNTVYQLSGWAKANGNIVYLGVKNFGGTEVSAPISTRASYGQTNVLFTTGSTNTTALIYAWNPACNGTPVYVDDLFLAQPLAAVWRSTDIGAVALAGDSGQRGLQFDLRGSGSNVGGTYDSFHFVSQTLTGDGRITARVLKVDPTDSNARAGIMLRAGTNASAANLALDWLSSGDVEFLVRTNAGQETGSQLTANTVPTSPFVRLERVGNSVTASWSVDGTNWNIMATSSSASAEDCVIGFSISTCLPFSRALFARL